MFSCEICENFKDIFFYRTPLVAASGGGSVAMLNHSLVDPDPHVTWKLESHLELFSRWKADLEEARNISEEY